MCEYLHKRDSDDDNTTTTTTTTTNNNFNIPAVLHMQQHHFLQPLNISDLYLALMTGDVLMYVEEHKF
jgi:hypothetical protein